MWLWNKIFKKNKKTVNLIWKGQYLSRDPIKDGTMIIHFAYSEFGTFEIYDDGNDYLVTYPRGMRKQKPADIYYNLAVSKQMANEVYRKELNEC